MDKVLAEFNKIGEWGGGRRSRRGRMKELPLRCDRCGDGAEGVAERVRRGRRGRIRPGTGG